VYLTCVDKSSCGEKGAERGNGRGPWTVQVSFRDELCGIKERACDGFGGADSSSR